jgi:hypothetical protein
MRISSSFALGVGKSQICTKARETRAANRGLLLYSLAYEARAAPNRPLEEQTALSNQPIRKAD